MTQFSNQRTTVLAELSWSSQYSTHCFSVISNFWGIYLCVCLNNRYEYPGNPETYFVIIYLQVLHPNCCSVATDSLTSKWDENSTTISEHQHFQNLWIFLFFLLYSTYMHKSFTIKAFTTTLLFLWLLLQVIISKKTKNKPQTHHFQTPSHK